MMKDCERFINRYADGELDERQKEAFGSHVAKCDFCKDRLGEILSLKEACAMKDEADAPFNFTATLMDAIQRSEKEKALRERRLERLSYRLAPVFAVALLLAVIWAGIGIYNFNTYTEMEEFFAENGNNVDNIFENMI